MIMAFFRSLFAGRGVSICFGLCTVQTKIQSSIQFIANVWLQNEVKRRANIGLRTVRHNVRKLIFNRIAKQTKCFFSGVSCKYSKRLKHEIILNFWTHKKNIQMMKKELKAFGFITFIFLRKWLSCITDGWI